MITAVNSLPPITNKSQGLISVPLIPQGLISPAQSNAIALPIPSYSGDFTAIPLPTQLDGITSITINGQILTPISDNSFNSNNLPSISNPLPLGFYWYDYKNQTLYIAPSFNGSGLSVLVGLPSIESVISVQITDFPSFFRQFNIVGTFTINRTFQGHPRAQLTIIDDYEEKYDQIEAYFTKGRDFTIRGIDFRADNPQLKINQQPGQKTGKMECTVTFKGKWEGYNGNIDSDLDKPVLVSELISDKDYYTVSRVASKVGVPFSGSDRKIYVSIPVSNSETRTLRALLDNRRFYPEGKIIDWEDSSQVKLRSLSSMPILALPHYLPTYDISVGDKTKLANAVLTLDNNNKGKGDIFQTITEGRSDYQSPPKIPRNGYYDSFNIEALRTPSWCFDIASEKTVYRWITQLNGFDWEIREEEWGFVYSSATVYELNGNSYIFNPNSFDSSPDNLWQNIRVTTKTFNYDPKTGYLISVTGNTKKLTRIKQETSDLEAIQLVLAISLETDETALGELQKQLDAYNNFFWVSEPYTENYTYGNLKQYYPELTAANQEIEDYYIQEFSIGQGAIFSLPNPDSTSDEPLPNVVIGEIKREEVITQITDTRLKKFKERQTVSTVKGYGLEDSISSINETNKNGVPSVATRLQRFGFTGDDTENDGETTIKYLISTDGATLDSNIENGSVDYPDITTLSEALKGIKAEYALINSRSEKFVTTTLKRPLAVVMGQNIQFKGEYFYLFDYSETYEVSGVVNCQSVVLGLGKKQSVSTTYVEG